MFKINRLYFNRFGQILQNNVLINKFSSAPPSLAIKSVENEGNETIPVVKKPSAIKTPNNLVAAAFASLKNEPLADLTPVTNDRISKASNVDELLSISQGSGVSRKYALRVVSVLAEWSNSGKADLSQFDSDSRFIRLCKVLIKGGKNHQSVIKNDDLNTIINVTVDDEAIRLISTLSVPQMIKVMSVLRNKKRRSTPLLRSIAFNVINNRETLNLKHCADLLYSSAVLNFLDENLFAKICNDICENLQNEIRGSATVGSILTSFGVLKYKNKETLDCLCHWILNNSSKCRIHDLHSLIVTLGALNHQPPDAEKLYEILMPQLNISETRKPSTWLDVVWALTTVGQAQKKHISSVLLDHFVSLLEKSSQLTLATKLKLLNIESASRLLVKNYEGPTVSAIQEFKNIAIQRSKDKEVLVSSVQDTFAGFLTPNIHMKTNINTNMGFLIDIELALDRNYNPIPLSSSEKDKTKVAVIVQNYHDMCSGCLEPTGMTTLFVSLLRAQNYKVLTVPYTEYNSADRLVERVKYVKEKLKNLRSVN